MKNILLAALLTATTMQPQPAPTVVDPEYQVCVVTALADESGYEVDESEARDYCVDQYE